MVKILKPGEPWVEKPTQKQLKDVEHTPPLDALCCWLEAQTRAHYWRQERDRVHVLGERLLIGSRWLDNHVDDERRGEGAILWNNLCQEQRLIYQNMRSIFGTAWYWCCLTYEAASRADSGWDADSHERLADASSPEAIWSQLFPGIDPPDSKPSELRGWPERQMGTLEIWNIPELQEQLRRTA